MLRWVQSGLSQVAGTAEPEYGREAIHPVTEQETKDGRTYREATEQDLEWRKPGYTNVETQTFYFTCLKTGMVGFAQVIHSNVMGVHTTAQFTFRLFGREGEDCIWTSTKLENFEAKGANFYAKNLSVEVDEETKRYKIVSAVNPDSIVELNIERLVPGVIFGNDGTTYYGDRIEEPWGSMRHVFWPRCSVNGTVKSGEKTYDIDGITMFVMAIQGMKPHHAAKTWNFLNFQSEHYSAIQMEFTTPKSYANTKVNVAILASNDGILSCSINNDVVHENSEVDEVGWPVPHAIAFNFKGKDDDGKEVTAKVCGNLNVLVERVDVMAEIPQFVKNIVNGVAGAKPYIYQFSNPMTIYINGEEEKGVGFNEATFISE